MRIKARDDRGDPALALPGTVRRGGLRLVGHRGAAPGPGPAWAAAGDADLVQQRNELRAVAVLARGQHVGDQPTPAVVSQVDLGAQPATVLSH